MHKGALMKVLSIIDSFKGTISSTELGSIMSDALNSKGIMADYLPISDGGDGFLDTIESIIDCKRIYHKVQNPLGKIIDAYYLIGNDQTVYIEMAISSGLHLLNKDELNPYLAHTYGLGELIDHALNTHPKQIIVGLGGSATNDGGIGMLEALGCKFFDQNNVLMSGLNGSNLDQINYMETKSFGEKIHGIHFKILSDVTNPLLNREGASYVFSKQKGASEKDYEILDNKMKHYANIIQNHIGKTFDANPGAGAAGGVGFAFYSMFKASIKSGIHYVLDLMNFNQLINQYDYLITGEGKIDSQSLKGKVIFEVSQRAQSKHIILVCAINEVDDTILKEKNIKAIYAVVNKDVSLQDSLNDPKRYFKRLCDQIVFE